MKQTINFSQFTDAFQGHGRENQFTYKGKHALFDYMEEYENNISGEEIELDVIGLCCDFTEYENLAELQKDYADIESIEDLEDYTTVIMIDEESFIIQNY